ncbi:hypothetical protein ACHAXT_010245 [Thalassiosira profunda]
MPVRKRICDAIASACPTSTEPQNDPLVDLDSQLDEIFASDFEKGRIIAGAGDEEDNDNNVTPLILACDKSCSAALQYLQRQIQASCDADGAETSSLMTLDRILKAWGRPSDASSASNGAAHHALAAGFCEGLDLLEYITCNTIEGETSEPLERYLSLLSQPNANADTPLMMACVSGHAAAIKHILQRCVSLALNLQPDDIDAAVKDAWRSLRDVFAMMNHEQYTALSFAYGHGHPDVVALCIQPQSILVDCNDSSPEVKYVGRSDEIKSQKEANDADGSRVFHLEQLVEVSYADVESCKASRDDLAAGLKFMQQHNQTDRIKEFETQHRQASECLAMLECELERISAEAASDLLLDGGRPTDQRDTAKTTGRAKGKSKRKKKTKQKQIHAQAQNEATDGSDLQSSEEKEPKHKGWAAAQDEPPEEVDASPANASPFITLQDGSVVSKSYQSDDVLPLESEPDEMKTTGDSNDEQKPLQTVLQSSSASIANNGDIVATMDSLCLEPSMLLLSSHKMAMEMSPCQLEAVESILAHQLDATREAQKIQRRLLKK